MKIIKVASYADLSKKAALLVAAQIVRNPTGVLGLPSGSTPEGMYAELIRLYEQDVIDFSEITTFNLDEYQGLDAAHPQSYSYYMREKLFRHVNIHNDNIHIPNGAATDTIQECVNYEQLIEQAGGIDLQLLGIGRNGHIGFNEPGESFSGRTYLAELAQSTMDANARFFGEGERVPTHAFSMGVSTIMQARSILLIANGPEKTDTLNRMLFHPVTPKLPASVLQFHSDVTVMYCD